MWAHGFRIYFTPLLEVLFTFPSRYSFAIGLSVVFSLSGWSPKIQPGFLVSRPTQVAAGWLPASGTGLSPAAARRSGRFPSLHAGLLAAPITPARASRRRRFGLIPFRSPLLGESLLLSLPAGTEMFQFPAFAPRSARCRDRSRRVAPFGCPRINGYLPLPAAFRSLSRPSSPPRAQASPMRPCCSVCYLDATRPRGVVALLSERTFDNVSPLVCSFCETLVFLLVLAADPTTRSLPALSMCSFGWRITDSNR